MSRIIRTAESEEDFQKVSKMTQYAFGSSPGDNPSRDKRRRYFQGKHELLLEDDGEVVATAASIPMTQNVRHKVVKMAGIAGVFTEPDKRKQGYVRDLMEYIFDDIRDKKQVVSTLYPFKESFYGRFGYINLPQSLKATINNSNLASLAQQLDLPVSYQRYKISENISRVLQLLNNYQKLEHGMALFPDQILQYIETQDLWIVEVNQGGECIGLVAYKMKGFEQPAVVSFWLFSNAMGKYAILRYFAIHGEQISELQLPVYHGQHLEYSWYNLTPNYGSRSWVPSAMGRVIDISELQGMLVGTGYIHLQVEDPHIPTNSGCWIFEADNDGLLQVSSCDRADGSTVTIQAISALIYGGYNLDDFAILRWADFGKNEIKLLDKLFPPVLTRIFQQF